MAKAKTAQKVKPRVVRSLHLPQEIDARITRGARLAGESIMGFIRVAADEKATRVIDEHKAAAESSAA